MIYWILTTEYPPAHGGGIGTYVYHTANVLRDKGHKVTVIINDSTLSEDQIIIENGIRLIKFACKRTNSEKFLGYNAYLSYEFAAVVKQLMEKEGVPDILEAQEYDGIAYYLQQFKLMEYKNFKDLTVLITCHAPSFLYLEYNHVPVYKFPYYWTGQMEKSSILSADILISPSKYLVKELKSRMPWKVKQENYLFNPIEIDENANIPEFKQNYIVCFGKLSPLKGTFELLRYFSSLWQQGFEYPLHIIGGTDQIFHPEGQTMEEIILNKYSQYLEKGLIVLRGKLTPAESRKELSNAHVILVPSIVDNLPYTVLEAMSWGKLVLASKQGGQAEVIQDGYNGFLFNHNIPGDFQTKLVNALALSIGEVKNIGANAKRTIVERFHPDVIYDQKIKIIESYNNDKIDRNNFPFIEEFDKKEIDQYNNTEDNDLLSIVIPYYNMGKYIEDCIESILSTSYPNKEILIIDDGSTDPESIKMLSYIESKYKVTLYRNKNAGLPLTRNFGASKAKGTYMAFLDADDTVEKEYFCKSIKVLKKYDNVHFVGCWVKYFENNNDTWPAFNPEAPYLLVHNMVNSSALIYKKNSFLASGKNDPTLIYGMEDWDSVLSMVVNGYPGVILPEVLYNYRVRTGSMARLFTRIKKLHLYKLIADKHALAYRKYGVEVANLLNSNGSGLDFDNPTFETAINNNFPVSGVFLEKVKSRIKRNKILKNLAYKIYHRINK